MAGLMHDALLVAGATAVCVTFGLLIWLYGRLKEGSRQPAQSGPLQNMAELSILFQTMRGLVREQKTLAREFNRSLDAKVEVVREAVKQVLAAYEQLTQMQKALKTQLDQACANTPVDATAEGSPADPEPEDEFPALRAIAMPEAADLIDSWQSHEPEPEPEVPDATPAVHAPTDPVEAREIRDALLMGEPPAPVQEPLVEAVPAPPTNGGAAALRSRVFKYHDAGMSVSDIAQELGLGKGEIRLMLSLREK